MSAKYAGMDLPRSYISTRDVDVHGVNKEVSTASREMETSGTTQCLNQCLLVNVFESSFFFYAERCDEDNKKSSMCL